MDNAGNSRQQSPRNMSDFRATSKNLQDRPGPVRKSKFPKKVFLIIAILLSIMAFLVLTAWYMSKPKGVSAEIDPTKYQVVLLLNGDAIFGKLREVNEDYVALSDTFVVRSDINTDKEAKDNDQETPTLVKHGNKTLHSPEDPMIINKNEMQYFQNISNESAVTKGIQKYHETNK